MKIQTVARLLTIARGAKANKNGKQLCASAQTPEEKAAAAAYRRVSIGNVVLVLALVAGLVITAIWALTTMEPTGRIGTVQDDGQIRYIQNTPQLISQEELDLRQWNLQPGDEVYIYTDSVTDEVTGGTPCAVVEYRNNIRLGVLLGFAVFMAVALLVYALVICRFTAFGSAWYRYCLKQEKEETEDIPPRVNLVINIAALAIALLLCWPQIVGIVENIRELENVGAMSDAIHSSREEAQSMIDGLDNIEITDPGALEDVNDAAEKIGEILDELNSEE